MYYMVLLAIVSISFVYAAENIPHGVQCTIEITIPDSIKKLLKDSKTVADNFKVNYSPNNAHESINVYQSMFMAFTRKYNKGFQESNLYLGALYEYLQASFKKENDFLQFDEGYCLTCESVNQENVELHFDRVHFNNGRINYVWTHNIDDEFHKCRIYSWNTPHIEIFKIGGHINEMDNTIIPSDIAIKITPKPVYNHSK